AELIGHSRDASHGDAPRLARREELVRVDVDAPADEVGLRVVARGAVDGGELLRGRLLADPARMFLRPAFGLFGGGAFHVAAWHDARVLCPPCRTLSPSGDLRSATAPSRR